MWMFHYYEDCASHDLAILIFILWCVECYFKNNGVCFLIIFIYSMETSEVFPVKGMPVFFIVTLIYKRLDMVLFSRGWKPN